MLHKIILSSIPVSILIAAFMLYSNLTTHTAVCVVDNLGSGMASMIDGLIDQGAYCRENNNDSEYTSNGARSYIEAGWHIDSIDHQAFSAGRSSNGQRLYSVSAVIILVR